VGILGAVLLGAGWWLLRPGAAGSSTTGNLQHVLSEGKPEIVEVYFDY
jgi:hypothetical protein